MNSRSFFHVCMGRPLNVGRVMTPTVLTKKLPRIIELNAEYAMLLNERKAPIHTFLDYCNLWQELSTNHSTVCAAW